MSTTRRLTDHEREQRRDRERERLKQAAEQLLTSNGWQRWVRVRAQGGLARLSLNNQLLVALSCPDATFVAGFKAWLKLGYCVRKGERAIRIVAPMPIKPRDPEPSDGEDQRRILFKGVSVFDIAQTEPIPGREPVDITPPVQPITGDSHAHLLPRLAAFAGQLGYTVTERILDGAADGWCDNTAKAIVVNATLPANARVRVLVHELAHALGIGYAELGRARAEVMVDCVTYIVCGQVGLDVGGETIPYVAGWGEDGALDAIQHGAQTIDEVARRIESVLIPEDQTLAA